MLRTRREMFEATDSSEEELQNTNTNVPVTKKVVKVSNDPILVGERGVVVLSEVQNESAQDHGDFIAIESKTIKRERATQLKRDQEAHAKREAIANARRIRESLKKLDHVDLSTPQAAPKPSPPKPAPKAAPVAVPAPPALPPAPVIKEVIVPQPSPVLFEAPEQVWVDPAIVCRGQILAAQPPLPSVLVDAEAQTDPVRILPIDYEGKETQTTGESSPSRRSARAKQTPQQAPPQPVAWWMRAQEPVNAPGPASYQMHQHHQAYDGRYAAAAPAATLGHYWNTGNSNPFIESGSGYWGYSAPPPPPPYSHPRP